MTSPDECCFSQMYYITIDQDVVRYIMYPLVRIYKGDMKINIPLDI